MLSSGLPYVTLIVATILTGQEKGFGYETLQGAYTAQEEFNQTNSNIYYHPLQIRLLVANYDSDVLDNPDANTRDQTELSITQKIIDVAKSVNVRGIFIGLPYVSDSTINLLNASDISITLSGSFSETQLVNTNSIFPIAASTEHEGQIGALYEKKYLQSNRIGLLSDPNSQYSKSLANAFLNTVGQENIVATETYTSRDTGINGSIASDVNDALQRGANLIYFAGDLIDADTALSILEKTKNSVKFMGGDALYELGDYTGTHYKSLYFTSFAFPDEWQQLYSQQPQPFPTIYRLLYAGWPLGRVYGYIRPDNNTILAYDALSVLQEGTYTVFAQNGYDTNFALFKLQKSIRNTIFQGFSGQISFLGSDQNNKLILVLHVTSNGLTQMVAHYGCLLTICNPV